MHDLGTHGRGVVEVAAGLRIPDHRRAAAGASRTSPAPRRLRDERRAQQEVFGRVPADGQLGKTTRSHPAASACSYGEDAFDVALQITDDDIDLGRSHRRRCIPRGYGDADRGRACGPGSATLPASISDALTDTMLELPAPVRRARTVGRSGRRAHAGRAAPRGASDARRRAGTDEGDGCGDRRGRHGIAVAVHGARAIRPQSGCCVRRRSHATIDFSEAHTWFRARSARVLRRWKRQQIVRIAGRSARIAGWRRCRRALCARAGLPRSRGARRRAVHAARGHRHGQARWRRAELRERRRRHVRPRRRPGGGRARGALGARDDDAPEPGWDRLPYRCRPPARGSRGCVEPDARQLHRVLGAVGAQLGVAGPPQGNSCRGRRGARRRAHGARSPSCGRTSWTPTRCAKRVR